MSQKASILIAEDDADDRFLLETAFIENGFADTIEFVENGVEVMNYLRGLNKTSYPHFILLDLAMPNKGGSEVLREIKEHPDFKSIPVVIFTTTTNEAEINRCYELGASGYVIKPYSFELLLKIIRQVRSYWLRKPAASLDSPPI